MSQVTIYFHRDFDGMVSAALIADYVEYKCPDNKIKFFPLGYGPKSNGWQTSPLKGEITFVLDYMFHPQATFWFDHHPTGLGNFSEKLGKEFFLNPQRHFWNPQKGSCALLIWEILLENFGYRNSNMANLVNWADKIDSVNYSLEEFMACQHSAFKIHLSLAVESDNAYLIELTRLFWKYKDDILNIELPYIAKWRFDKALIIRKKALEEFKQNAQFDRKLKIVFYQMSQSFFACRFAPFYFYPDCIYAIGIIKIGESRYMIAVNENPWQRTSLINIGHLCSLFGGGGHAGVGAINVSNYEEAKRIASLLAGQISSAILEHKKDL